MEATRVMKIGVVKDEEQNEDDEQNDDENRKMLCCSTGAIDLLVS